MLHFLRRIRRSLINTGATRKYLLYAVGEILLVMIGILLALQVNNWNDDRKEKIIAKKYMIRLKSDLIDDSLYYSERITKTKNWIKQLDRYIDESYNVQKNPEEVKQLFSLLALQTDHLTTNNTTYRELTSSGQLKIFSSDTLSKAIIDYYRENEELAIHIKEFNLVSTENLGEVNRVARNWIKYFSLNNTPFDKPEMFLDDEWSYINNPRSEEFQAIQALAFTYWMRNGEHLWFLETLKKASNNLIKRINLELDLK
jgi:hypothetical protein